MIKKPVKALFSIMLLAISMIGSTIPASAMNDTATKDVYIMGNKVGTIEARIWAGTGDTFDATSSSWVSNQTVYISNHINQMQLAAGGLNVSIVVPTQIGNVTVGYSNNNKTATFTTQSVSGNNATYRGINTYSNRVSGIGWWVDCYSMQTLQLDTQPFAITAHCWKGL